MIPEEHRAKGREQRAEGKEQKVRSWEAGRLGGWEVEKLRS
jgi:hypothetical protein